MNGDQQLIFSRLTDSLNRRYGKLSDELCRIIDDLDRLLDTHAELAARLTVKALNGITGALIAAANQESVLHEEALALLHRQIACMRSAKQAYAQGWDDRLVDLYARADPDQAAALHTLITEASDDDEIPF